MIAGSIANFGKYWLDETSMVLSLDVHASTFANLTGNPSEMRNIASLTDSELKFTRPFMKDVTLEAVFKRAELVRVVRSGVGKVRDMATGPDDVRFRGKTGVRRETGKE